MTSLRRVPAVLLTVLLGVALTGCGDDAPDEGRGDASADTPATPEAETPQAADPVSESPTGKAGKGGKGGQATDDDPSRYAADEWKQLCFLTNAEVGALVPTFAPYGSRDGAATNLDRQGAPVDLYCAYESTAGGDSGVQVMARPYVEDVDYADANDYATPDAAWKDACDDGDFDCGKLAEGTPYAIFGETGYGALYPTGNYYFQVVLVGDDSAFKAAEVKAMVEALEAKVASS